MQDPTRIRDGRTNAVNYKDAGINTFVGLWDFPTDRSQYPGWSVDAMAALKANGLRTLAGTDPEWISRHPEFADTLWGYHLGDEPDMFKVNGTPEDQPEIWQANGDALRSSAGARAVHANFGKGFCLDPWIGYQGIEAVDFPRYVGPTTIVSCDYYAVTDPYEQASWHGIWGYGRGIDNLRRWASGRPAWGFVEATAPFPHGKVPNNIAGRMPPAMIAPAVWMMVVHGAAGIQYFCHDFSDGMVEDGCLADPGMADAMRAANASVQRYAGVLERPDVQGTTATTTGTVPVTTRTKRVGDHTYVFAMGDGNAGAPHGQAVSATIAVQGASGRTVEVLGEGRSLALRDGRFVDTFAPYELHVYRLTG